MKLDTKTYWLTDCQSQCNFDFDVDIHSMKCKKVDKIQDRQAAKLKRAGHV
jgi:hypothetical protein